MPNHGRFLGKDFRLLRNLGDEGVRFFVHCRSVEREVDNLVDLNKNLVSRI